MPDNNILDKYNDQNSTSSSTPQQSTPQGGVLDKYKDQNIIAPHPQSQTSETIGSGALGVSKVDENINPNTFESINTRRYQKQSGLDRISNSLANLGVKTIGFTGQSIGYLLGAPIAAVTGDITKLTENPMVKAFSELNDNINKAAPVYKPPGWENMNMWDKLTDPRGSYLQDELMDRFALMGSMIAGPENLVGKGLGIVGGATKVADALIKTPEYAEALQKTLTAIKAGKNVDGVLPGISKNLSRLTMAEHMAMGTLNQSAMSAKQAGDGLREALKDPQYDKLSPEEKESKAKEIQERVFWQNVPLSLATSAVVLPQLFSTAKNAQNLYSKAFDQTGKMINPVEKSLGSEIAKAAFLKGPEVSTVEGVQVAIDKYNKDLELDKTKDGWWKGVLNNTINNYTDPEGQSNIFLGYIEGALETGLGAVAHDYKVRSGKIQSESNQIKAFQNAVEKSKLNYQVDTGDFLQKKSDGTPLIIDGKPQIDQDKLLKVVQNQVGVTDNLNNRILASYKNNKFEMDLANHNALSRLGKANFDNVGGYEYLQNLLKLHSQEAKSNPQQINDIDKHGNDITPDQVLSNHLQTLKELRQVNEMVNKQSIDIDPSNYSEEERIHLPEFKNNVKNAMYNVASTHLFYQKQLQEEEQELEELKSGNSILSMLYSPKNESLNEERIKELENDIKNHNEAFKDAQIQWKSLFSKEVLESQFKEAFEKEKTKTPVKETPTEEETNKDVTSPSTDMFAVGKKVQLRGSGKTKEIESYDPETKILKFKDDSETYGQNEVYSPSTLKNEGKETLINTDLTSPYTGARKDGSGIHPFGTDEKVKEILSNTPKNQLLDKTRVRLTKNVSVNGNIERGIDNFLSSPPSSLKATLGPNKSLDVVYELQDKDGNWFDAAHGPHDNSKVTVDPQGLTKGFHFNESTRNQAKNLFNIMNPDRSSKELTDSDIDQLIQSQNKLDQINSIFKQIHDETGETTISAKDLYDKYGVKIDLNKGTFDVVTDESKKPSLSNVESAKIDGDYFIYDRLLGNNLIKVGDTKNIEKSEDLQSQVNSKFLDTTFSRYVALVKNHLGDVNYISLDTPIFSSNELSPLIEEILSSKELSQSEKNKINDKIASQIHIISKKGTRVELKVDTDKEGKPNKLQLVQSNEDGEKTYTSIPLAKNTSIESIVRNASKELPWLKESSFRKSIPSDTSKLTNNELGKMFISNVSTNVFKPSKLTVDIDQSKVRSTPVYNKVNTDLTTDPAWNTWNKGFPEGDLENKKHEEIIKYYLDNSEVEPDGGESFDDFIGRLQKKIKETPKGTTIVVSSQVIRAVKALESGKFDRKVYDEFKVKSGETYEINGLKLIEHGKTAQSKSTKAYPDEDRNKNTPVTSEGIKEVKKIAVKEPIPTKLETGDLLRNIKTGEAILDADKKDSDIQKQLNTVLDDLSKTTDLSRKLELYTQKAKLEEQLGADKDVISEHDQIDEEPINKLSDKEPQVLIDIPEAKEWLQKNLPQAKVVTYDDVKTVLNNLETNGLTWGFFKDKVIYLSTKAGKGTEFHEAFHYVFRTLLSNNEINQLYKVAQNRYGKPTKEDLSLLKSKRKNQDLTTKGLEQLFFEEKMADQFMSWKEKQTKLENLGLIGKLIQKINNLFNWITGHNTELESFFEKINLGSFKNSDTHVTNMFNNVTDPVFKQIPNGEEIIGDKKKYTYTPTEKGRQIIRDITGLVIERLEGRSKESRDSIINEVISDKYNFDKPENNISLLESKPSDEQNKIIEALQKNQYMYSNEDARRIIVDQVNKTLDTFEFLSPEEDLDEKVDEEANERKALDFDRNAINLGGFDSLNKEIRTLLGTVMYPSKDEFGRDIRKAVSPQVTYQAIERVLSNTHPDEMINKLKLFSEFNEQTRAVYNRIWDNERSSPNVSDQLFQKFINSFTKEKLNYLQILMKPNGDIRIQNANTKDVDSIQLSQWFRDFDNKKDKFNEKTATKLTKASQYLSSLSHINSIRFALDDIGVNVSEAYVKFSILSNIDPTNELVTMNSETKPLTSEDLVQLATSISKKQSPFEETEEGQGNIGRLKIIAKSNAQFDENILSSNFQDAEGKTRWSYIMGSLGLERTRELGQLLSTKEGREQFKNELSKGTHDFSFNKDNFLVNHENADSLFKKFEIEFTGDLRQDQEGKEGVTFKSIDARAFKIMQYALFSDTKKRENLVVARYYPKVLEASSSAYSVQLPVKSFYKNGRVSQVAIEHLYKQFLQEVKRISITTKEIDNPNIQKIEGYHTGAKRGQNLFYFKYLEKEPYGQALLEKAKTFENRSDLSELEDSIMHSIEQSVKQEIELEKKSLIDLGILNDKLEGSNSLFPASLRDNPKDHIGNFYLNNLINLNAYNDLIEINPAFSKNSNDNIKRAKRWIASKVNFGRGQHIVGFRDEPKAQGKTKEIDIADAQAHIDINHFKFILKREGKLSTKVNELLDKINDGEKLNWDEVKILQDSGTMLNNLKTVTASPIHYHKMSDMILTRNLTSIKNDKGEWVPRVGREKLHEIRTQLENLSRFETQKRNPGFEWKSNLSPEEIEKITPARILPPSASKLMTPVPAKFDENGKLNFSKANIVLVDNKYSGRQVDTPSGKTEITYGTQLIQLIDSEQNDNEIVNFNGKDTSIGELRQIYQKLLSQVRTNSVNQAKTYLGKLVDNKLTEKDEDRFRKKLLDTLETSGADDSLLTFFGLDPKYNLNLPNTLNKYEQLFLAHFTKGVLSQKAPGLKLTLVSGDGYNVLEGPDGKLISSDLYHSLEEAKRPKVTPRELKYNPQGLSEVALPAFTRELHNLKVGDSLPEEVLKMFGIRIPTEDKHSMLAFKVVEFLPSEYGSICITPKEVIELAGSDFDIDSLFATRKDYYMSGDRFVPFGTATTIEGKWLEYQKDQEKNNKDIKKAIKHGLPLEEALKSLQLPSNLEEFKKETKEGQIDLSNASNNNHLVDVNIKMLTNKKMTEIDKETGLSIATTPSSTTRLGEARDKILALQDLKKNNDFILNSPVGQFTSWKNNSTGAENIGPAALMSIARSFLSKGKVHLKLDSFRPEFNGKKLFDFSKQTDSEGNRVQDNLGTVLSAMTDNAKDPMAYDLNLSLTSLGPALQLISLGASIYDTMLLVNTPIVKEYTEAIERLKTSITKSDQLSKKKIQNEFLSKIELIDDHNINTKELEDNFKKRNKTTDSKALKTFIELEKQGQFYQELNSLISLNKGLPSSFKETDKIDKAINDFGLGDNEASELIPFDITNALKGTHILNNVKLYQEIKNLSKQFVVTQSETFKGVVNDIESNLNPFIKDKSTVLNNIKLDLLSHLMVNHYLGDKSLNQSLLTGDNNIIKQFNSIKNNPEVVSNKLIKFLKVDNAIGTNFKVLTANTRIKLSSDQLEEMTESFRELFNNPKTNEFAKNLFEYLIVKDNLQFKNNSFVKFISPFMFTKVSKVLDHLVDNLDKDNHDLSNFKDIWFRHIENQQYIQKVFDFSKLEKQPEFIKFNNELYKLQGEKYVKSSVIGNDVQSPYGFKNSKEVEKANSNQFRSNIEEEPSFDEGLYSKNTFKDKIEPMEVITPVLEDLKKRFNIEYEVINDPKAEWKGKFENGKVVINSALVTVDTPFHEFAHPFVRIMREQNKEAFNNLLKELETSPFAKNLLSEVKELYPKLNDLEQKEEAIVTAIGKYAAMTKEVADKGFWDRIKDLLKSIADYLGIIVDPSKLPNLDLAQIGALIAQGKGFDVTKSEGLFSEAPQQKVKEEPKLPESPFEKQLVFYKRQLSGLKKLQSQFKEGSEEWNKKQEEINKIEETFKKAQEEDSKDLYKQLGEQTLDSLDKDIISRIESGNLDPTQENIEYAKDVIDAFREFGGLADKTIELGERLFPYINKNILDQVNEFATEKGGVTQEQINSQNKDINTWKKGIGALADSPNYIARTIGMVIKKSQNIVETKNKQLVHKIQEQVDKLLDYHKKNGGKPEDAYNVFIQEHKGTLALTKRQNTQFYNELYDSFSKLNSSDSKKVEEGRAWISENAIKEPTSGEWVATNSKYSNPNWGKIQKSKELSDFYKFYQDNIQEMQKYLPIKFGKDYIPNVRKESFKDNLKKLIPVHYDENGQFVGSEELEADIIPSMYHRKLSIEDKSRDLGASLLKFGQYTNNHDQMTSILPNLRLLQAGLENKFNTNGQVTTRKFIKSSDPKTSVNGVDTNLYKQVDTIIDMQVLGKMKLSQGRVDIGDMTDEEGNIVGKKYVLGSDLADLALKYNSMLRIGFSPITATANIIFGDMSNFIEAIGGRYFTLSNLHQATTIFFKQNFKEDSFMYKFLEKTNPLQELDDYQHITNVSLKKKMSPEKIQEYMYAMQKGGEKYLQTRSGLAIAIKDGYCTKEGVPTEKWNNITDEQANELSNKIQSVNQMMHGRYSQKEAAAWQQNIMYRLCSQFRKWLPAYIESRFNEYQWDNRKQAFTEGRFRTFYSLLRNLGDTIERLKKGELTELETYNMKKNLIELALWGACAGAFALLHGGSDDDAKKRRKNPAIKLTLTLLNRACGDLNNFYSPSSNLQLIGKAVPLTVTATTILQAIKYLPGAFGSEADYKSGSRKGRNKELASLERVIPGAKFVDEANRIASEGQLEELNQ